MASRVRLIDIAQRLNITKVSVSKALRDHPDISRETRALVKKMAAEMGYSPNLLARSLSSRRTHTLGVVVPKIAHTFFASVIDAIQEHATQHNYGIVLAVSNESSDLERQHIERLLAMRVDGLLISVSQQAPDLEIYERVRSMKVPLVFFDRRIDGLPFSSVTVDDEGGARQAIEYLIRQGHRKIAHIAGTSDTEIGRRRRRGYEEALKANGIEPYEPWIIEGGFDEQHGYQACRQILALESLPDAVFVVTYPVGLGARAAMQEADPLLPDRIELVSFGAGGFDEFYTYPHYCIQQPTSRMGAEAVRLLLEEIDALDEHDETLEPREIMLETRLMVPGESFGFEKTPSTTGKVAS